MDRATLVTTEIAGGLGDVRSIAVGPDALYVVDIERGAVGRVPRDGGAFAPIDTGEINPRGVTLDAAHVWWTEGGYGSVGSNNGKIHGAGLDGSNASVLYSGRVGPDGIAVSAAALVWTEFESDDVAVGAMTGGGAPTAMFANEHRAHAIAVAGSDVYFTDYTASSVRHLVLGGAPATIDAPPPNSGAYGLALDANAVYWVARSAAGTLWATPRDGQPHTGLAQNLLCPTQVAVDDECVYWVEQGQCNYPTDTAVTPGTGRVMRTDKAR
jgi:sugar lactone lactonase YvrE